MPIEPLLALLLAAIAVNTLLLVIVIVTVARRRPTAPTVARRRPAGMATDPGARSPGAPWPSGAFGSPPPPSPARADGRFRRPTLTGEDGTGGAFDRVVRVVSWSFILATTAIVASSGRWPDTQSSIYVLMACSGVFILVVHEILPASLLGEARYVVEGSLGITISTLLVVLTGGAASPFFFAYLLIVAGAALVLSPRMTLVVTGLAIGGYLVGVLADSVAVPLTPPFGVLVAANLVAIILLTYVALVVASAQRRSRDAAIEASTVDSLTGLYNRAYFFAAADREIQRSARSQRGFSLLMMDLDGLKPINDRYGHFQGDRVLRSVGEIIRHGVRRIDTAARYGGDEFVVLLPETEPEGAYILAEKIRQGVTELAVETPSARIRTSLSIGVVVYPEDGSTADDLMISADQAMYASKRRGRNRIVGYRPPRRRGGPGPGGDAFGSGPRWTAGSRRPGSVSKEGATGSSVRPV